MGEDVSHLRPPRRWPTLYTLVTSHEYRLSKVEAPCPSRDSLEVRVQTPLGFHQADSPAQELKSEVSNVHLCEPGSGGVRAL